MFDDEVYLEGIIKLSGECKVGIYSLSAVILCISGKPANEFFSFRNRICGKCQCISGIVGISLICILSYHVSHSENTLIVNRPDICILMNSD